MYSLFFYILLLMQDRALAISALPAATPAVSTGGLDTSVAITRIFSYSSALLVPTFGAIAYLTFYGIKYMLAANSPEGVKKARSAIINGVIGIALLVAIYAFIRLGLTISDGIRYDSGSGAGTVAPPAAGSAATLNGVVRLTDGATASTPQDGLGALVVEIGVGGAKKQLPVTDGSGSFSLNDPTIVVGTPVTVQAIYTIPDQGSFSSDVQTITPATAQVSVSDLVITIPLFAPDPGSGEQEVGAIPDEYPEPPPGSVTEMQ